jgi:hypothetical protein
VELSGTGRNEESNYLGSDDKSYTRQAKAGNAVAVIQPSSEDALVTFLGKQDANIDSGCSITMTPYRGDVN